jgi:hypothetical protein
VPRDVALSLADNRRLRCWSRIPQLTKAQHRVILHQPI